MVINVCIAIASMKNNPIPTDEILKTCFRNNSHGAGFAFNTDNNQVKIVKGFMDFDSFITALHEYDEKYNLTHRAVLLHFRIGTSGRTTKKGFCAPSCTHPFPISSKDKHLKKLNFTSDYAVVHNGIINFCADSKSDLSDTMLFVKNYLTDISSNKGWFYNPKNINLIYNLIYSKMAILNGKGDIIRTEGFHKADDGNFYSNNSYMPSYYGLYDYNFYNAWYEDDIDPEYIQLECPLMQLKYDETVIYDDGRTEGYESGFHDIYPLYLTKEGDLFANYNYIVYSNKIPMEDLTYLGHGHIIKENSLKKSEFRKDAIGYV